MGIELLLKFFSIVKHQRQTMVKMGPPRTSRVAEIRYERFVMIAAAFQETLIGPKQCQKRF
jgi:hypothetical protein